MQLINALVLPSRLVAVCNIEFNGNQLTHSNNQLETIRQKKTKLAQYGVFYQNKEENSISYFCGIILVIVIVKQYYNWKY